MTVLALNFLYQSTSILNFWIIAIPISLTAISILGMFSMGDIKDEVKFFLGPIIAFSGVVIFILAKHQGYVEFELTIVQSIIIGFLPVIGLLVQAVTSGLMSIRKS